MGDNFPELKEKIATRNPSVAADYFSLPEEKRKGMLSLLSPPEVFALTNLIKEAKRKAFEMGEQRFISVSEGPMRTPLYLIDTALIEENMRIMQYVKDRTGCKILHALKAYATTATFPLMRKYLDGTCASGYHEARLGFEEFGKEVHTFGAAYREDEFDALLQYSHHIIFNSFSQLRKYGERTRKTGLSTGIRINPGYSEVENEMYNPCAPASRLGVIHEIFYQEYPSFAREIAGLHFHVLCEQGADTLERVLQSFESLYGSYVRDFKWVNFGGGHHLTRDDYDLEKLIALISAFKEKYGVQVYLEPGEASVLYAGVLIATVIDVVKNGMEIAIIDASAEAHMPDVLFMPYRPCIMGSGQRGEKKYLYRIGGPTCLAGDIVGDYSFDKPLSPGDRLVFTDMAHYSIVKNTTFNGINLPDIAVLEEGKIRILRRFGYDDYRTRQG